MRKEKLPHISIIDLLCVMFWLILCTDFLPETFPGLLTWDYLEGHLPIYFPRLLLHVFVDDSKLLFLILMWVQKNLWLVITSHHNDHVHRKWAAEWRHVLLSSGPGWHRNCHIETTIAILSFFLSFFLSFNVLFFKQKCKLTVYVKVPQTECSC